MSVFFAKYIGEAALGKTSMHRHLSAFESAHFRVTGDRAGTFMAAAGRLAATAAHTATDPLLRPILSFRSFEIA